MASSQHRGRLLISGDALVLMCGCVAVCVFGCMLVCRLAGILWYQRDVTTCRVLVPDRSSPLNSLRRCVHEMEFREGHAVPACVLSGTVSCGLRFFTTGKGLWHRAGILWAGKCRQYTPVAPQLGGYIHLFNLMHACVSNCDAMHDGHHMLPFES